MSSIFCTAGRSLQKKSRLESELDDRQIVDITTEASNFDDRVGGFGESSYSII